MTRIYNRVPTYAYDYPPLAKNIEQVRLPFYCMNCYRKKPTTYTTPNFGPLCADCVWEMESVK